MILKFKKFSISNNIMKIKKGRTRSIMGQYTKESGILGE
jgi:hypothetical protein